MAWEGASKLFLRATYDVRSDLAAHDVVHSNHICGIGGSTGRRVADEESMDVGS